MARISGTTALSPLDLDVGYDVTMENVFVIVPSTHGTHVVSKDMIAVEPEFVQPRLGSLSLGPLPPVRAEGSDIAINQEALEPDRYYPVIYRGKRLLVHKPELHVVEIFEVEE